MKERVGDEKVIIINVTVSGINDHIRFYSYCSLQFLFYQIFYVFA